VQNAGMSFYGAARRASPFAAGRERASFFWGGAWRAGATRPTRWRRMATPRVVGAGRASSATRAAREPWFCLEFSDRAGVRSAHGPPRRARSKVALLRPVQQGGRRGASERQGPLDSDLRRQEVHSLALLRQGRTAPESILGERAGPLDPPRRHAGRALRRNFAPVCRRRDPLPRKDGKAGRDRATPVNLIATARAEAVRGARSVDHRPVSPRLFAPHCAAAAGPRTSRTATARTMRSAFPPAAETGLRPGRHAGGPRTVSAYRAHWTAPAASARKSRGLRRHWARRGARAAGSTVSLGGSANQHLRGTHARIGFKSELTPADAEHVSKLRVEQILDPSRPSGFLPSRARWKNQPDSPHGPCDGPGRRAVNADLAYRRFTSARFA